MEQATRLSTAHEYGQSNDCQSNCNVRAEELQVPTLESKSRGKDENPSWNVDTVVWFKALGIRW